MVNIGRFFEERQRIRSESAWKEYYKDHQIRLNNLAKIAKKFGYELEPKVNTDEGPWISDAERLFAYGSSNYCVMKPKDGVMRWVYYKSCGKDVIIIRVPEGKEKRFLKKIPKLLSLNRKYPIETWEIPKPLDYQRFSFSRSFIRDDMIGIYDKNRSMGYFSMKELSQLQSTVKQAIRVLDMKIGT